MVIIPAVNFGKMSYSIKQCKASCWKNWSWFWDFSLLRSFVSVWQSISVTNYFASCFLNCRTVCVRERENWKEWVTDRNTLKRIKNWDYVSHMRRKHNTSCFTVIKHCQTKRESDKEREGYCKTDTDIHSSYVGNGTLAYYLLKTVQFTIYSTY